MTERMVFLLEIIDMVLIMVAVIGSLYIKMILIPDIESHHNQLRKLTADCAHLESRIRILEKRAMTAAPEKLVIAHEYAPDKDAPKFGRF